MKPTPVYSSNIHSEKKIWSTKRSLVDQKSWSTNLRRLLIVPPTKETFFLSLLSMGTKNGVIRYLFRYYPITVTPTARYGHLPKIPILLKMNFLTHRCNIKKYTDTLHLIGKYDCYCYRYYYYRTLNNKALWALWKIWLLRSLPYFISFTDIDANIAKRYFHRHFYRYFNDTIGKVWV